jgi:hypothetical protein
MAKRSTEQAVAMIDRAEVVDGRIAHVKHPVAVRVLARAEGYAMVRRPRAMPFVISEADLQDVASVRQWQAAGRG